MNACVFCGGAIKRTISLQFIFSFQAVSDPKACPKCLAEFKPIQKENACPGCSRMQDDMSLCADCIKWQTFSPDLEPNHTALFTYNEAARTYMNRFKFQGDVHLADLFSEKLYNGLTPYIKTHQLTIIPTSTKSFEERGFNAVELFLQAANIAYEPFLEHVKTTKRQSSKSRSERLKADQPFALISPSAEGLKRPVLIVDDVYTTGRTIYHARELLGKSVSTASFSLFR